MTRSVRLLWLVLLCAGCTPEDGAWRRGPVQLSPTPIVLRPPRPLNPGDVRADLCVGLPPELQDSMPRAFLFWPDSGTGIPMASGHMLRVRAVLRTTTGAVWEDPQPHITGVRGEGEMRYCFGGLPPGEPRPRIVSVELSASAPLRVTHVEWRAAAFGSL